MFIPFSIIDTQYDVKSQFGAKGDGVSNDSSAIQNAINTASASGGGLVAFPPGTYICSGITPATNVYLVGSGYGNTILKLANGANTDLIAAQTNLINLSASFGTSPTGTLHTFGIGNMTLDGNYQNQTGGPSWPLRVYAYEFLLWNLVVTNGYSGGIQTDWNGSGTPSPYSMEAHWYNVRAFNNGYGTNTGIGIEVGGPHDSIFDGVISHQNASHCIHIAPNAVALQLSNSHFWGPQTGNHSVAGLIEAQMLLENCQFEGSDDTQVVMLASEWVIMGGHIFGAGTFTVTGIQIGQQTTDRLWNGLIQQSGGNPTAVIAGGYNVNTHFSRCEGTNGAIYFSNDGGGKLDYSSYSTGTKGGYSATGIANNTVMSLFESGRNPDGTQQVGGTTIFPQSAFSGMLVRDGFSGVDVFNVNTMAGSYKFELPNAGQFKVYSDAYSTVRDWVNYDGRGSVFFGGTVSTAVATKTAAYSIQTGDSTILCNATTAAFTVTLPTAVGNGGIRFAIKKTDSSANAVTVATTSSQTIDGVTTKSLPTQYNSIEVVSDGSNWNIL